MKPVCDGWHLNAQSNSDNKYLQLKTISKQLKLGLKIEQGEDFDTMEESRVWTNKKGKDKLMVKMPEGDYITGNSATETFLLTVCHLGIENIRSKHLEWSGRPIITNRKTANNQMQVDPNWWITVPNATRDKVKLLRVIGAMLHAKIEVNIIQQ